jgi:competence protein ComEA
VDPTAAPWRVLEDPADRVAVAVAPATATLAIPRSVLLMAGGAALLAVLAFLLAFGSGAGGTVLVDGGAPLGSLSGDAGVAADSSSLPGSSAPELVVEIVGAIDRPGVFRLPAGSRVGDLVAAAGGYGARVDAGRASRELNLAALLHDGDQVRVPSRDDEQVSGTGSATGGAAGSGGTSGAEAVGPLDLNRATSTQLEGLPGIGPVTAGKILASREEQPFKDVQDLRARKLVGEKTFEKLKGLVAVR